MSEVKQSILNTPLRQERLQQGWSQVDVANKIGSDPKTVGRWERGVTTPSPYFCQKLCQLYGKTPQGLGLIREDDTVEHEHNHDQEKKETFSPTNMDEHTVTIQKLPWWRQVTAKQGWVLVPTCALLFLLISAAILHFQPYLSSPNALLLNDPYTGNGALALNDSLSSNTADWSSNQNAQGNCHFQGGGYVIRGIEAGYMEVCLNGNTYFSNFTYETTMKITAGDCGGLAFRANFPLLYYFLICQDGHYRLVRYDRDHAQQRRIISNGLSNSVHTGYSQTNTVAVVADGTTLEIYVNQHLIGHFTDSAYSSGQIGLIVHTCRVVFTDARPNLCDVPTEVFFQNAKVWKL